MRVFIDFHNWKLCDALEGKHNREKNEKSCKVRNTLSLTSVSGTLESGQMLSTDYMGREARE